MPTPRSPSSGGDGGDGVGEGRKERRDRRRRSQAVFKPFAELVEVLAAGLLHDLAKRPGPDAVVVRDAHCPKFASIGVSVLENHVAAGLPDPLVAVTVEDLRNVFAGEIA